MRKLFMIAAMALMVSSAANAQESMVRFMAAETPAIDYSFSVNNNSVARYLNLDEVQDEQMVYIFDRFDNDLRRVASSKEAKRTERFMKALSFNLSASHKVLNDEQYHKYLVILNNTLRNKGLDAMLYSNDLAMAD